MKSCFFLFYGFLFHEGQCKALSSSNWPMRERMLHKNYLEVFPGAACSLEGTGTQTHVCKVKGKRFLRERCCRAASTYFLREKKGERANVGGRILPQVILKGISSKRTAWRSHITSTEGWIFCVQRGRNEQSSEPEE